MSHDWLLDVLADLRSYARANGLAALERELREVAETAAAELAGGRDAEIDGEAAGNVVRLDSRRDGAG